MLKRIWNTFLLVWGAIGASILLVMSKEYVTLAGKDDILVQGLFIWWLGTGAVTVLAALLLGICYIGNWDE